MKKLLIVLSALLMLVAVSCSNDTPATPSAGLDGTDLTITVPSVDEDNVAPELESIIATEFCTIASDIYKNPSNYSGTYEYIRYENGYGEDGNKTYAQNDDGSYTIGVDNGLLKAGDVVEGYDSENKSHITVNDRTYRGEAAADYIADYEEILSDLSVRNAYTREAFGTARRVAVSIPVLDDEGNLTYEDVEVTEGTETVTVSQLVSEEATVTFDYSYQVAGGSTKAPNGTWKSEEVTKVSVDLRQPVLGISSVTVYSESKYPQQGPYDGITTYVIEVTRDDVTSVYAYYPTN